jgi:hypothetical protein
VEGARGEASREAAGNVGHEAGGGAVTRFWEWLDANPAAVFGVVYFGGMALALRMFHLARRGVDREEA